LFLIAFAERTDLDVEFQLRAADGEARGSIGRGSRLRHHLL